LSLRKSQKSNKIKPGKHNGCRTTGISVFTKTYCTASQVWHSASSLCEIQLFLHFSAYFTHNSGLWYKERNSLFVLQDQNLLAPYINFFKNDSYDCLLRFCYLWLSISGGCSCLPFSRLTSELRL
jgi:hypothetical protein